MNFSIVLSEKFKKEARRLIKKYPSLKKELEELEQILSTHPETGTPLGFNTYKIRISIKSKSKGKSGGGRVITYVINEDATVYLLTIYDKSEFDSVDSKTLKRIIENLSEE